MNKVITSGYLIKNKNLVILEDESISKDIKEEELIPVTIIISEESIRDWHEELEFLED